MHWMWRHTPRLNVLVAAFFCLAGFCGVGWAQARGAAAEPLTITTLGAPLVDLDGPWQFHLGNDARWASPGFNDSGWKAITTDKGWDLQGYSPDTSYGWYRRHVRFADPAAAAEPLALLPINVNGSYEVFWNGVRVGGCGEVSPHPVERTCWTSIPLPTRAGRGDAVLAIRAYSVASYKVLPSGASGLLTVPRVGTRSAVEAELIQLLYEQERSDRVGQALGLLYAVAAVMLWVVWLLNRGERLYLWLALFLSEMAFDVCLSAWGSYGGLSWEPNEILLVVVDYGGRFGLLCMLLMRLFRLDASAFWRRFTLSIIAVNSSFYVAEALSNANLDRWTASSALVFRITWGMTTTLELCSIVLIVAGVRRKVDASRWCVAVTATSSVLCPTIYNVFQLLGRWDIGDLVQHPLFQVLGGDVTVRTISAFLLLLSLCYAATQSLLEARRKKTETELELRSAAEVQHVLIPEEAPELRGLRLSIDTSRLVRWAGTSFRLCRCAKARR